MDSPFTFWFILIGVIILAACIWWAWKKITLGFIPEEVSHSQEDERLQILHRKIRYDVHRTLKNSQYCFRAFSIVLRNRYSDLPDPGVFVVRDRTWRNLREHALKAARKGYRDCERVLRIRPDPSALLIREAVLYGIKTCTNCPLLEGQAGSLKDCPISERLKNEVKLV